MAQQLNLSINELWSLLTRTFEALYGHERDYYDMARTALWLECHGHDGIEQLLGALSVLEATGLPEPNLTEHSPNHAVIDAGGHSLFCIGRSIADLAMSYASTHVLARLDIANIADSQPLIGVLSYIASRGFSAAIIGEDMQAIILPNEQHPILYEGRASDVLCLICSKGDGGLTDYIAAQSKILKDKESQKDVYSMILEDGVNLQRSHYDKLTTIANRVLVEATEASRKGAGE